MPPDSPPFPAPRETATDGAFSPNTERALRADLAVYTAWCRSRGLTALPAPPETVADFVDAMADDRAPATVRRYVATIGVAQRAAGLPEPARAAPVRLALQRMHRRRGRRQRQVHALTWPLRQRLIEAAGERLIDDRNRALVAVAYDGLLRRSEVTELAVADLAVEPPGWATLLVRRGKTDPEGRGVPVYLARDTVALVRHWLDRGDVASGRLFRSLTRAGRLGASLHPTQIPRIFRAMAHHAGVPADVAGSLSGHSARVGAAQDMIASGIDMAAILHAGRWKSPAMVNRYGERLLAHRSGTAQLARLQQRG